MGKKIHIHSFISPHNSISLYPYVDE
ncbi:hypothetical protein J2S21_000421 [Peribacillus cavernae]|nr:hypothetical protein [Peribacillus cavernae]